MGILHAQVAFQGLTGLPRDRFENTFCFTTTGVPTQSEAMAAAGRIAGFYVNPRGAFAGQSVMTFLSPQIAGHASIKLYDDAEPKPRPILLEVSFAIGTGGSALPSEVALCLSYFSNRNVPRQRGRIYVGPFNKTAVLNGATAGVDPGLLGIMGLGGAELITVTPYPLNTAALFDNPLEPTPSGEVIWSVYSRVGTGTSGAHVPRALPITAGWIDDEWDLQHRRRVAAVVRTTY